MDDNEFPPDYDPDNAHKSWAIEFLLKHHEAALKGHAAACGGEGVLPEPMVRGQKQYWEHCAATIRWLLSNAGFDTKHLKSI